MGSRLIGCELAFLQGHSLEGCAVGYERILDSTQGAVGVTSGCIQLQVAPATLNCTSSRSVGRLARSLLIANGSLMPQALRRMVNDRYPSR
jgi:hypothetical protein